METRPEDGGLARGLMLGSSWDAACGALAQSLHVAGSGVGAGDLDWEELLAPPAPGCARCGDWLLLCDRLAPGRGWRGGGGRAGRGSGPGIADQVA